ncbi:MAG: hypothetical protein IJA60_01075 [Clostridia bacterium]|nr:hypothetical protein [Clostridia bacterium]
MYVSVPKNYSGIAFPKEKEHASPPPKLPPMPVGEIRHHEPTEREKPCDGCKVKEKNPLACMMEALRKRKNSGFDTEDFLLVGLIALLLGKEGNEDIILVLAMLLLI